MSYLIGVLTLTLKMWEKNVCAILTFWGNTLLLYFLALDENIDKAISILFMAMAWLGASIKTRFDEKKESDTFYFVCLKGLYLTVFCNLYICMLVCITYLLGICYRVITWREVFQVLYPRAFLHFANRVLLVLEIKSANVNQKPATSKTQNSRPSLSLYMGSNVRL